MAENTQNNKSKLFREKNLERLESPEKLNDYLRVTSPGVWMVLVTVIVLLAGVCVWGFIGKIEATTQAAVITENGVSKCLVPRQALEGVLEYRTVKVDGEALELQPDVLEPEVITESTNVYVMLAGMASEGIATGTLVTEELSPAELFFN